MLADAWRSFEPRSDRAGTLKELFTSIAGRRPPQLPPTQALAGVSLQIDPGETVGIVGRNGAGKTSTLRVLAGIIPLHRGFAGCGGRVATLIELGAGFGREFTGRENMRLNAALHGMARDEIDARIGDMIAFSELGHFIEAPIKTYSTGMLVRLGFSVAAHLDADVLMIDEVLAVGDESFQQKCLRRIAARIEQGTTVVLVSHAPATIVEACRRVVVLDGGRVTFDGPTAEGLDFYHRLLGLEPAEPPEALPAATGPRMLREARLEDGDGRSRQIFGSGEPMRVVLVLEAAPDAQDIEALLEVRQATGQSVFRTTAAAPAAAAGGLLVFETPHLSLLGGDYDLALTVRPPGREASGDDRVLSFSVAPAEGAEGIADLRGTWTFAGARAEVRP
jgi:ABC-type polysaccharide/polyol phosphate transport system ATPase subunit